MGLKGCSRANLSPARLAARRAESAACETWGMASSRVPDPIESVRHQLRPLFDQIVIKELDQDRVRRSGLVVPPGTHEPPPEQGIVLAVGPGLDWWASAGVEMPIEVGDHVVFPASAGVWVEVDEERLLVCRVTQLLGVLESAVMNEQR
jgi:chaperonin GroES